LAQVEHKLEELESEIEAVSQIEESLFIFIGSVVFAI
jgi:hypothetical protein